MHSLAIAISIVSLPIIYWGFIFFYKLQVSAYLVREATPFSLVNTDLSKKLLVLGDSTAVGVGASNNTDSVPAKLAAYIDATYVENYAVSGARVKDVAVQLQNASHERYEVILLQVGANDVVRFTSIEKVLPELESLLISLQERADTIIFISAGNVGGAPIIPPPLRPMYTRLHLAYHEAFQKISDAHGVTYINIYQPKEVDPFIQFPELYFARDSFHPSSLGYGLWFDIMTSKGERLK